VAENRYLAVTCPHCNTKQAVDKEELCTEADPFVLDQRDDIKNCRCVTICTNDDCHKRFVIENVDCTGYIS
jgi:hypothetical protein